MLCGVSRVLQRVPLSHPACQRSDNFDFRVATVGYGSQVPSLTNSGSLLLACIVMIFGQLYLSMPLAIIGKNYTTAWNRHDERMQKLNEKRTETEVPRATASKATSLLTSSRRAGYSESQPLESCVVYAQSQQILSLFCELTQRTSETSAAIHQLMTRPAPNSVSAALEVPVASVPSDAVSLQVPAVKIFENLACMLRLHRSLVLALRASLQLQQTKYEAQQKKTARGSVNTVSVRKASDVRKGPRRTSSVVAAMLGKARQAMRTSEYPKSFVKKRYYHTGPPTLRSVLWNIFEHNDDSRSAQRMNTTRLWLIIASIAVFFLQTTPELQKTGLDSVLCKRAIEDFCQSRRAPGCFVADADGSATAVRVDYHCSASDVSLKCYGHGYNFGSDGYRGGTCADAFGTAGARRICKNRLCQPGTDLIVDMEASWVYPEVAFGVLFTLEMLLRAYSHPVPRRLWRDSTLTVDLLALFPFYVEIGELLTGSKPVYSVVPTEPSFFTGIRVLKAIRILKLGTHIPGARVLTNTARLVYQRLAIPLFFLFLGCVVSGAVFYELERGKECFVGQECQWWDKNVLTPVLAANLLIGKRVLIQNTAPTTFVDMLRSTWFSLVTITTVGYGDLTPHTSFGKLFDIAIMMFSACYTAMPLSLVGEQFYVCYEAYVDDEKKHQVRWFSG